MVQKLGDFPQTDLKNLFILVSVYIIYRVHDRKKREREMRPEDHEIPKEAKDFHIRFLRDLANGLLAKSEPVNNRPDRAAPQQRLIKRTVCKLCHGRKNRTIISCFNCKEAICKDHSRVLCLSCTNNMN